MTKNEGMTATAKRLKEFLENNKTTKYWLARELNLWQPTVNGYFLEGTKSSRAMPLSFLESVVALFPDLDCNWLLRGESKPLSDDDPSIIIKVLEEEIARLKKQNTILSESLATLTQVLNEEKSRAQG